MITLIDNKTSPLVLIGEAAYRKMMALVEQCDIEIGWLGFSKRDKNTFFIYDVITCEQDCHGATTELKETALQDIYNQYMDEPEKLNDIRVWGHSHVKMEPNPSGQDDETFKEYAKDCDYFIRLIFNKDGKYTCAVSDLEKGIIYNDVKISIHNGTTRREIMDKIAAAENELEEYDKKQTEYFTKWAKDIVAHDVKKINSYRKVTTVKTVTNKSKKKDEKDDWFGLLEDTAVILGSTARVYCCISNSYEPIYKLLDGEDIDKIAYSTINDVKTSYKNIDDFADYSVDDWSNLIEACELVYCEALESDYSDYWTSGYTYYGGK